MTMAILLTPSQFLCISLFVSAIILLTVRTKSKSKNSSPDLPPGPWKLPLIGNMHNLIGAVPHRALHRLSLGFGPIMSIQLGELSAVVISTADAARQVMKTQDSNFASRPQTVAADIITYGSTSISFSPYGDYWRRLRKICTLELLSQKRVNSFRSLRERLCLDLAARIGAVEGSEMNLTAQLYPSAYGLISRATLGEETKEHDALQPILTEMIELASGFDVAEMFPSVKLFRAVSRLRRRVMVLHKEADKILEGVIRQHGGEEGERDEDLLDVLLKFQEDGLELPLTTDNIKSVILDMLGAGSDSSATTIDWAMAEMVKNPKVLAKAQEEVRNVFDEQGRVDESRIHELKYLKAVMKETLRIHPPSPLLLPRKCSETCELNGYQIPAEAKVIINAWAVNRDPKYWENGDCFQPERFLDNLVDFRGNHFEFIPFGAGRRMCPGVTFGLANMELVLATFLYHFDWKLRVGVKYEEMDMSDGNGMIARRKEDLLIVPIIKRSLPIK